MDLSRRQFIAGIAALPIGYALARLPGPRASTLTEGFRQARYSRGYFAIPRIGSGRDADNAFRPDFIGRGGIWPRSSKATSIFDRHPTHVIARVISEQAVLDDLRGRSGVRFLGDTIEQARNFLGASLDSVASLTRDSAQQVFDINPTRYSRLGPSPLFLINEPTPSPTSFTDADVLALLAARPAGYPRRSWFNRVRSHFAANEDIRKRLLEGRTQIWAETWPGTNAGWTDADEDWTFWDESGAVTVTQTGGEGIITFLSVNSTQIEYVGGPTNAEDAEIHAVYDTTAGAERPGVVARLVQADSDYYFVHIDSPIDAGADARLFTVDNGSFSELDTDLNIGPIDPGEIRGRFEDNGANTRIRGRFWSGAEPGAWNLDATTTTLDEQTGDSGLRSQVKVSTSRSIHWTSAESDDLAVGGASDPVSSARWF